MLTSHRRKSEERRIVGLIDIGSTKICSLMAAVAPPQVDGGAPSIQVLGLGHQRARGIKAGVVTDLDEAESAISAAVGQAERAAGIDLSEVIVAISCGRLRSKTFAAKTTPETGVVDDADIARLLTGGRNFAESDGRTLVHLAQIGYRLDDAAGIRDPRGMAGQRLAADLHAVTADESPVRNLLLALERCHLSVAGLVAGPYAAALAATTEEERRLGVTTIDIGGGTTSVALFAEGHFLHTDAVAIGGNHITFDIARALSTPLAEAERIKALYGTMVAAWSDEHEIISYAPAVGDEEVPYHTTKAQLREIIRPRVESLFSLVGERIARSAAAHLATRCVVLTGGASQLVGLGEFAANALGRPVRVARPLPIGGIQPGMCNPAFSTVIGLLHAVAAGDVAITAYQDREVLASGYLKRVGEWLREF